MSRILKVCTRSGVFLPPVKHLIAQALIDHLESARAEAVARLNSLKEALESEAKSTAGDKHETGRAMIHQEMEHVDATLQRCERHLGEVSKWVNSNSHPQRVSSGVLVQTNGPWVLVGIPLGKIQVSDGLVLAISSDAPVAQAWKGAKLGDTVQLGPHSYIIKGLF